jgi:hypothetical protein
MTQPRDPNGRPRAARRLAAAILPWVTLPAAMAWVLIALRLAREDVAGIEQPGMPLAVIQLVIAVLGALGAGIGASRAGAYVRTGRGGREARSSILGALIAFGVWALLVL